MDALFTSKQVADILGTNESSVKRWSNNGMLKCFKTPGGHRKFKKDDVLDFAMKYSYRIPENIFPVTESVQQTNFEYEKINEVLLRKLLYDNEEEIFDYLNSLILSGMAVTDLFDNVIAGAMEQIGNLWMKDKLGIEAEHIATGRLTKAVIMLQPKIESVRRNGLTAFCGCFEGEFHELPLVSLSVILKSLGWKVINAGANLPVDAFVSGIRKYNPDLVCLSSTYSADSETFGKNLSVLYESVQASKSKLITGGSCALLKNPGLESRDFHAPDLKSIVAYIRSNFPS